MKAAEVESVKPTRVPGMRVIPITEQDLAKGSNVRLRCGDCMHYKGTAHPALGGQSCVKLGVNRGAKAPACYTPNVSVFREASSDLLQSLFTHIASFTPQQQRILMGMLRNAASLNRTGFSFMETVYFSTAARGAAVLADYFRGFVAAKGPSDTLQIVGLSYLNGKNTSCVALLPKESLLTAIKFNRERKRLIAAGKLQGLTMKQRKLATSDDYEAPTLDTAAEFLERNAKVTGKRHGNEVRKDQRASWSIDQDKHEKTRDSDEDEDDVGDNL